MAAVVEVNMELGHRAKVRDVPSPNGHTHDWVVFVKGSDGIKLEHFVEKIVFWLHESYEPSKRVIKRAPYKVEESGFAGFIILIDVHFRNHEEPKMVRFQYDLFLLTGMPPVNHTRLEKLTFTNPTEDFRKKLLKAGAVLINPKSKDRSQQPPSPSSKKERSRLKDGSKHRSGSSHRSSDEKKRSSSAHSIRKDGRIPGKDMTKHAEEFKHPKPPDSGKTHKNSSGSERVEERGRSEKRRTANTDDDGNKKKKKKHSDDHLSSSQQPRPKSLPVSSQSSQNPPKKEKVRKIREKPDLMAGLFAPENSINMTQIKQSKEKAKQDVNDAKFKKEKKATPSPASRRSVSPHHNQEEGGVTHSSKISTGGNLTLKIKKERITGAEEKKKAPPNPPPKPKKKEQSEKIKKRSGDSMSTSFKSKPKDHKTEHKKKRTPPSSSSSPSSSSGSDMDISSGSDSSSSKHEKSHIASNITVKAERVKNTPELQLQARESPKILSKSEKKPSNTSNGQDKVLKIKNERGRSKGSPKTLTERQEKPRIDSTSCQDKTSSSSKHKKSSRDEQANLSTEKSNSESSSGHKSKKRSSKEKIRQSSEKKNSSATPTVVKKEKRSLTPSSTPMPDRAASNKEQKYETPPSYGNISPAPGTKVKKPPKPTSAPSKEKEKSSKKKSSLHRKSSSSSGAKLSPQRNERPKPYKSRSIVQTSSDSDSDVEPPLKHALLEVKQEAFARKDSISSQSSSSSQHSHEESLADDKTHVEHQQEYSDSPLENRKDSSSNSESSGDEEMAMREFPPSTSTMSVISPIRDQSSPYVQNPRESGTAFQDMEMSDSSDDNNDHPSMQENIHENHHPSGLEDDHLRPKLENIEMNEEDYMSSSDDDNRFPPEKPFQHHQDSQGFCSRSSSHHEDSGNVIIFTGTSTSSSCPPMTDKFYRELQDLQQRISYVTDVDRLRKIAWIVAKSHKLLKNDGYLDFDLCSLDSKTIHKIQKQLEAV